MGVSEAAKCRHLVTSVRIDISKNNFQDSAVLGDSEGDGFVSA